MRWHAAYGFKVDPSTVEVLDRLGSLNPMLKNYALKDLLAHRELVLGEVVVGSLAFSIKKGYQAPGSGGRDLWNED
jgi:hypothetical protein